MSNTERRNYAKNEGIQGTQCLSCQRKEGAELSKYSKFKKNTIKLKKGK